MNLSLYGEVLEADTRGARLMQELMNIPIITPSYLRGDFINEIEGPWPEEVAERMIYARQQLDRLISGNPRLADYTGVPNDVVLPPELGNILRNKFFLGLSELDKTELLVELTLKRADRLLNSITPGLLRSIYNGATLATREKFYSLLQLGTIKGLFRSVGRIGKYEIFKLSNTSVRGELWGLLTLDQQREMWTLMDDLDKQVFEEYVTLYLEAARRHDE